MSLVLNHNSKLFILPLAIGWFALQKRNKFTGISAIVITLLITWFHRSPTLPPCVNDEKIITSPAFGTIGRIHKHSNKEISIEIFLSITDVHVQYSPIDGIIVAQKYITSTFHPAFLFQKSEHNERLIHTIHGKFGRVIVQQIAGILARRIFRLQKQGDELKQNQRIGFISFGSRVDLILDSTKVMIECKTGQHIKAGEQLARFV